MKLTSVTTLFTLSALASGATAQPTNGKNPVAPQSNPTGDAFLKQLIETAPLGLNISNVRQLQTVVTTSAAGVVGEIITLPFDTIPPGFLECNGQAVSRDEYPELFAAIGTRYGLGTQAINTFKLPDLAGYVLQGHDTTQKNNNDQSTSRVTATGVYGPNVGGFQQDAIQKIIGTIWTEGGLSSPSGAFYIVPGGDGGYWGPGQGGSGIGFDSSRVARTASETRVKNMAVKFCIRAKPISDTSQSVKTLQLCDQAGQNCVKPSDILATSQKADQTSVSVAALTTDVSRHQQSILGLQTDIRSLITANVTQAQALKRQDQSWVNQKSRDLVQDQSISILSKENTRLKQNATQTATVLKQTQDELDEAKRELSSTKDELKLVKSHVEQLKEVYQYFDPNDAGQIKTKNDQQNEEISNLKELVTTLIIVSSVLFGTSGACILMLIVCFCRINQVPRGNQNQTVFPQEERQINFLGLADGEPITTIAKEV